MSNKAKQLKLQHINLDLIDPDPNQPRKYFDQHKMEELMESIEVLGVKQPILVRPQGERYMIVAGERRFRAAKSVKILHKDRDTIPAMIEELSDKETREIQITENLQRDDVKPLEEAVVFKDLIENFNLNVKEISHRIGKSMKFVSMRISLNDLIPDFREMLQMDILNLTDAYQLARVSKEMQQDILDYRTSDFNDEKYDWREKEGFAFENVSNYLSNKSNDLSEAKFDITNKILLPKAGACTTCIHNSNNQGLLFDSDESICTNPVCFGQKTEQHSLLLLQYAFESGKIIYYHGYSLPYFTDRIKAYLNENDIKVYTLEDIKAAEEPDHPGSWDEFYDDNSWIKNDSDSTAEEIEQERIELQKEYQEAIEEYENDLQEYKNATGLNAFDLRSLKDNIINFKNDIGKHDASDATAIESDYEINKIVAREVRARELDGEKIWKKVCDFIKDDANRTKLIYNDELMLWEHPILVKALASKMEYPEAGKFSREFIDDQNGIISFKKLTQAIHWFMINVLVSTYGSYLNKGSGNEAISQYIRHIFPNEFREFELGQEEIAIKRLDRVKSRILAIDPGYDLSFLEKRFTESNNNEEE